jgi:hypothetical protein
MPAVLTTMPWTGAAAGELVASCSPPWPSPGSSRTAPAGRSRSSSHRVPLPHHPYAMGVRLAERLTPRTRQLRHAPSPQDRPPGSAAPTRRPARRHSARLSEDRHPLRRDHRLGPSPRGSSLTMKNLGCLLHQAMARDLDRKSYGGAASGGRGLENVPRRVVSRPSERCLAGNFPARFTRDPLMQQTGLGNCWTRYESAPARAPMSSSLL